MPPELDLASGFLATATVLLLAVVTIGLARGHRPLPGAIAGSLPALACLLAVAAAARLLAAPGTAPGILLGDGPSGYAFDADASFFLLLLAFSGFAASLYGWGSRDRVTGVASAGLALLLLAAMGVLGATGQLAFLLAAELFGVAAWLLVAAPGGHPDVRAAGASYLAASQIAVLLLTAGWMRWQSHAGGALLLGVAGIALWAGLFPLHRPLQGLIASAPAAAAALLATTAAVLPACLVVRATRALSAAGATAGPGPPFATTSALLLLGALGSLTLVLVTLFAMADTQLGPLLARGTIASSGLLAVALAAQVALPDLPEAHLAVLLATAAHVTQRTAIHLTAGSLAEAAGSDFIDRLGGLARLLPGRGLALLAAAAAASALPPFAGFAATALILHTLVATSVAAGFPTTAVAVRTLAPLAATAVALGFAIGTGVHLKLAGLVLLGRRRDSAALPRGRLEASVATRLALALPLGAALVLGVFPAAALGTNGRGEAWGNILTLALALATATLLPWLWLRLRRRVAPVAAPAAASGVRTPAFSLPTASGFAQPFTLVLAPLYGASEAVELVEGHSPLLPRRLRFTAGLKPAGTALVAAVAERGRRWLRPLQWAEAPTLAAELLLLAAAVVMLLAVLGTGR